VTTIPPHLQTHAWYPRHLAYLAARGLAPRHDPGDAVLRRAYLSGAILEGAILSGADLTDAVLRRAVLRRAYLSGAILEGAILSGAILSGADLTDAVLRRAYLSGAILEGAILEGADLTDADLSDADLTDAILEGADLTDADLSGAILSGAVGIDDVPRAPIQGLAALVLHQLVEHPESWDQSVWHSECHTRHCCAGWTVVLAGPAGEAAERRLGTPQAAVLLLGGSGHPFGPDDDPRPWLRARAATENRA
jgi:hypothetical protein